MSLVAFACLLGITMFIILGLASSTSRTLNQSPVIDPDPETLLASKSNPRLDLFSYTVKELRVMAKDRDLKGVGRLRKADLVKRLRQ